MWKFYILKFVFIISIASIRNVHSSDRSRIGRQIQATRRVETFEEIVRRNDYLVEEHVVITKDGYILSVHRIFGGPKSPPAVNKPVVLLLHGMVASSDVWILRGPEKDLAYLLVDEGLDVWLINFRGNTYSRKHVTISPKNPEFWRFSWHESGVNDLPETIDYIISKTGIPKITLVGHSMGTTVSYVLLSLRPEYNKKIDLVVSLAPVAIFTGINRGPLTTILPFWGDVKKSFKRTGVHEVFSHNQLFSQIAPEFCSKPIVRQICSEVIVSATGHANREQFDTDLIPFALQHYPAGTSVGTIDHYYQNIVSESFRKFDFGMIENYARYGSSIPPAYPLEKITAPNILYYSNNDWFVQSKDVQALEKRLPNMVARKIVQHKLFNHLDFIISKDSKTLLYDDVINVIKQHKAKRIWRI